GVARPAAVDVQALAASLETALDKAAAANPNPGSVRIHRLNRAEYANAIRDLFALDVDMAALLPNDDIRQGFDNIASALKVSPSPAAWSTLAAARISAPALTTSSWPSPAGVSSRAKGRCSDLSRAQPAPGTRVPAR